jgi:hypothetical protein
VANARKVRLIGESRKKDDRLDAQTLARLARIDVELLSPVKQSALRALLHEAWSENQSTTGSVTGLQSIS